MPFVTYSAGKVNLIANFSFAGSTSLSSSDPDVLYFNLYPNVEQGLQNSLNSALSTVVNGSDTFNVSGELYQLLINQISVANLTSATPVTLTLSNGNTVSYSLTDANILLGNISTYLTSVYTNYNSLNTALAAASNYAALSAINVNSGWPSNIL